MEGVIALSIPIFIVLGCIFLAWSGLWARHKKREMVHTERMRALELGQPVPQLPVEYPEGDAYGNLKAAIILLFLGGAFAIGSEVIREREMLMPAGICASLGFAFLVIHWIVPKAADQHKEKAKEQDVLAGITIPPGETHSTTP